VSHLSLKTAWTWFKKNCVSCSRYCRIESRTVYCTCKYLVTVRQVTDPPGRKVHGQAADGKVRVEAQAGLRQLDRVLPLRHEALEGHVVDQLEELVLVRHERVIEIEPDHVDLP